MKASRMLAEAQTGGRAEELVLEWPVRQGINFTEWNADGISNYVDLDPAFPDSLQDYNCGTRSYDLTSGYNHAGTDVFAFPFSWRKMDNGTLEVVAAADGVIVLKLDGNADRNCGINEQAAANAIFVRHSDGTIAWYLHFRKGSLTHKVVGDSVRAGEYLGIVGSSGSSTEPHLHFELQDPEGNIIDPFLGVCNYTTDRSWWKDQPTYRESRVNGLFTHGAIPDPFKCYGETVYDLKVNFSYGDTFYISSFYRDELKGQKSLYRIIRPNGSPFVGEFERESPDTYNASFWYFTYFLPTRDPVNEGQWTLELEYEGETYTQNFYLFDTIPEVELATSTNNLDFGSPLPGSTYLDSFTIQNPGKAGLIVDSIRSTGPFRANWSGIVHPGTEKTIKVVFTPQGIEFYKDTIVIYSDAISSPDTVFINATGGGAILDPGLDLDFGRVVVDSMQSDTTYLKNTGNIDLTISSVSAPEGFSVDWTNGIIAPGDSQQLVITFMPIEAREYSGVIRVESDALEGTDSFSVSGTGEAVTALNDPAAFMGEISLFPNPADTETRIKISMKDGVTSLQICLFAPDGKLIQGWTQNGENKEWLLSIDLETLPAGIYSIELIGADWVTTRTLVVR